MITCLTSLACKGNWRAAFPMQGCLCSLIEPKVHRKQWSSSAIRLKYCFQISRHQLLLQARLESASAFQPQLLFKPCSFHIQQNPKSQQLADTKKQFPLSPIPGYTATLPKLKRTEKWQIICLGRGPCMGAFFLHWLHAFKMCNDINSFTLKFFLQAKYWKGNFQKCFGKSYLKGSEENKQAYLIDSKNTMDWQHMKM